MPSEPATTPAPQRARRPAVQRRLLAASVLAASVAVISGAIVWGGDDAERDPTDDTLVVGGPRPGLIALEPSKVSGEVAPDVSFERFDGSEASLADYRGTPVVLNFFASWCAPCVSEMPEFERVHQELGASVVFLGMNLDEPREDAERIVEQTGVTYEIAIDTDSDLYAAFEGFSMPTTVFIDADGTVVSLRGGAIDADELRDRIAALMS